MNERENGQSATAKRTNPSRIPSERWEQIKVAYVSRIGLREIARKMNIPEGTVLAHAKRHGWTQQIQVATQQQSDAITPVQSVPQSIAAILGERKDRSKLGLAKFTALAAEQAAEHKDKLGIAGKVKDVARVHKTLWPEENQREPILNLAILTGEFQPRRAKPVFDAQTGEEVVSDPGGRKSKELPSPVIEKNEKVPAASSPAMDCDSPNVTNPTISRAPASANACPSAGDDSARSAYREKCMYWRRQR